MSQSDYTRALTRTETDRFTGLGHSDIPTTPALSVVISTHYRPVLVRQAIEAIVNQDLKEPIETIVVFDKEDVDLSLASDDPMRPVRVLANTRTPGLPGSRNTGAAAAAAPIVGFCDDDDTWLTRKARLQLELMRRTGAPSVGSAIEIRSPGGVVTRASAGSAAKYEDLVRRRIPEAYMTTIIVRRDAFFGPIGPVAEDIPGGFAEDYEWWLRAARYAPVPIVTEPLYAISWQSDSYFRDKWQNMADGLEYVLDHNPGFDADRRGLARIQCQRAFAMAALGNRRQALQLVGAVVRLNPVEVRLPFVLAVLLGVDADKVMALLNRFGRGI